MALIQRDGKESIMNWLVLSVAVFAALCVVLQVTGVKRTRKAILIAVLASLLGGKLLERKYDEAYPQRPGLWDWAVPDDEEEDRLC
jgi:hypothetical protein